MQLVAYYTLPDEPKACPHLATFPNLSLHQSLALAFLAPAASPEVSSGDDQ
jgi:hypothetical protein